jgi:hypothetical protein
MVANKRRKLDEINELKMQNLQMMYPEYYQAREKEPTEE